MRSARCLTALDMQRHLAGWQGAWASLDAAALEVRMGLHTGRAAVGASGASHETGAVVVGDTVTRAVALQHMPCRGPFSVVRPPRAWCSGW